MLPSLLSCDFAQVQHELATLEAIGVPGVHLDVMDGAFVPNLTFGPPLIRRWREVSNLFFDAHLMMIDPAHYLGDFLAAGCDRITIHIEPVEDPAPILARIAAAGCLPALSLNPPTPVERVLPYLDQVDAILVMSVMPGFGGQPFDPSVLAKVQAIRNASPRVNIQMDGGLNARTIPKVVAAGVTEIVAGSAFFQHRDGEAAAYDELVGAIHRAMEARSSSEQTESHD